MPPPPPPLVSIGLPVRNGAPRVGQAIADLLGQTWSQLRLIVSDNASTDDTEAICRRLAAADPRVSYHRQATNIGPWANFRFVLDRAEGPYFLWAAHDDARDPRFIETCVEALEADPGLGLAFTRYASALRQEGRQVDRRVFGSLDPFLRLEGDRRLAAWILLDEYTQKANLIYGVWRAELARESMARFADLDAMVYKGLDIVLLTYVLARSAARQLEEVLFTKQYEAYLPGSASSRLRPVASFLRRPAATLRKAREFTRDHGHHLRRALSLAGALTPGLERVIRLKQALYFLPVYRYLTSRAAVLAYLRLRGWTDAR